MATKTSVYSLLEQAKRLDPDGKMAQIVEALDVEMGMILQEAPWIQSNDIWTNKTTRRASHPTGTWRKLNKGVAAEGSRVDEVLDVIGMLETYAEYDKKYIDTFPSPAMARLSEAMAFLEGLGKTFISALLYSNVDKDPDQIQGLAARLAALDGKYVVGAGGSGSDVTSIYAVTWGPNEAFLTYPKNSNTLGINHRDLGEQTLLDADNNKYQGYRDHFEITSGLVVKNPKCIGRVANIETAGTSNIFDEDDLITLLNYMKTGAGTRLYVNQTIMIQAEIALKDKTNVNWTVEDGLGGVPFLKFRGIPVRKIDESLLLNTETAIT